MKKFFGLIVFGVLMGSPALAQMSSGDPEVMAGYQEAERQWNTDSSVRQSNMRNINTACSRGRANKRMGKPGLASDSGMDVQFALLLSQGKKQGAGATLWAYNKLKSICPDAF